MFRELNIGKGNTMTFMRSDGIPVFAAIILSYPVPAFFVFTTAVATELNQTKKVISRSIVCLILSLIVLGGLAGIVFSDSVKGIPYSLTGEWEEKAGTFVEWIAPRKPSPQRVRITLENEEDWQGYTVRNIRRGNLIPGDEVRFLVKPHGDDYIYVVAWRRADSSEWNIVPVSFPDVQTQAKSFGLFLLILLPLFIGPLVYAMKVLKKAGMKGAITGSKILIVFFALATIGAIASAGQMAAAYEDAFHVQAAYALVAILWFVGELWNLGTCLKAIYCIKKGNGMIFKEPLIIDEKKQ